MAETAMSVELRRIASAGLHDHVVRIEPRRWPRLLWDLRHQRATGLAVAAWESGQLQIDPDQVDELLDEHRVVMTQALQIEQRLVELAGVFDEAGITALVLKGAAMAHVAYPDPAMRPFGDLDLLVSAGDWPSACAVLVERGYVRDLPEPRPGFDVRFGKAATYSDGEGVQIDLHRTLVLGPFGLWLEPEELVRHAEALELGGRTIARLDGTGLLLHAALHAGLGAARPMLLQLRDVVQAARAAEVDWARMSAWAAAWRLTPALRRAFDATEQILDVELPEQARSVASATTGPFERRVLHAYVERRRAGGIALATARALPGLRAKVTYAVGLLLPSREFLRARAGGEERWSYASRWRTPMRWVVARMRGRFRRRSEVVGVARDR